MVFRIPPFKKVAVCLIAVIHSIFLYDGIQTTITEDIYFARDEDLQYNERVEATFLYGGHFILICCLIYSVLKNNTRLILPWLVVALPVFLYMTFMVLRGIKDMRWYLVDELLSNFCYVGISWAFWSVLFLILRTGDYRQPDILIDFYFKINRFIRRWK